MKHKDVLQGILSVVLIALLCMLVFYLVPCFIIFIVCMCFGLAFSWANATGILILIACALTFVKMCKDI